MTASTNTLTSSAKVLVHFLLLPNKQRAYTPEQKAFCKNLYYKYPSAYNHLREMLGKGLPLNRTIARWENSAPLHVGLIPAVMTHLQNAAIDSEEIDREVALIFDEMDGKKGLRYCESRDIIVGFEEVQGVKPKVAKKFAAFMIRGINGKLGNVLLATFATENGLTGHSLSKLIPFIISKVKTIGYRVLVVNCDQAGVNRRAFTLLNVSADVPYFYVDGVKVSR